MLSLLDTSSSSHEGSQTELTNNDSFSFIKPDLSEKAKQLSQRLQDSLSSNITEAKRKKEEEEEEEGEDKSQSVSPVSTVSSSGAVQGEYVVNPEEVEQGEEGQEEEGEEEEGEEEGDDENDEDFGKIIIINKFY